MFIKPRADRHNYYELEVSPKGTIFDLAYARRRSRGDHVSSKFNFDAKVATKVDGTINDPTDSDKGWVVEGRVPISDFKVLQRPPKSGDQWVVNICRYDYSVDLDHQELSTWSPHELYALGFHRLEDYGILTFAE